MDLKDTLYTDRLPSTGDVEVFLWYKCGLSCAFCKQDHKDCTGMTVEDILLKKDQLASFFRNTKSPEIITTILGGEIFGDYVSDELLNAVYGLFRDTHYTAIANNSFANFDNSTNLMFNNIERMYNFLEKLKKDHNIKVKLCISYDLADRFTNEKQRELFIKNEKIIEEYVDLVSFVMSKNTVRKIIEGFEDPYFDYLYSKYPLSFSQYNDNEQVFGQPERTLKLRPNEPELFEAIKILAKKYPKIYAIEQWKRQANKEERSYNSCNTSKLVILPDNEKRYCLENNSCASGSLAMQLAEERNCLCCEYFGYCQIECFHSALDKRIEKVTPCLQKKIYDYLAKETPLQNISS